MMSMREIMRRLRAAGVLSGLRRRANALRSVRRGSASIRGKLVVGMLIVGFVPTVTAGAYIFQMQRSSILEDRRERLAAIGTVQRSRVLAWIDGSEQSLALTASRTQFRAQLARLQDPDVFPQDRSAAHAQITRILNDAARATGGRVAAVHALDRDGVIVASTAASRVGEDHGDQPYVSEAMLGQPSMSTVGRSVTAGLIGIHGAVVEEEGRAVGLVVLEQNLAPLLLVLGDVAGLGSTGESMLVANGPTSEIVSLAPLRNRPAAALSAIPGTDDPNQPAALALSGVEADLDRAVDYRGEDVIAVTRPIERTGWGLVLKQDRAEVVGEIEELAAGLLTLALAVLVLMLVASWVVATRATRHIAGLTAAARLVTRGDREARAPIETTDELAELAVAFNLMTDQLVGHEKELETRKAQLESVLYVASHDLKTPLRSVSSFGQILRLDYGPSLDDRGLHYLERIEDGATRTIDVIDDLMAYVRIDHHPHQLGTVDLSEAARSAVELLSGPIAEGGTEVRVPELGFVHGNHALLVQLFQNLIGNAMKFCPEGRRPVIEISAQPVPNTPDTDRRLEVLVADNGLGILEEFRSKVFAPFERLHSAEEVAGTGLGLALCHRIVRLHRGSIDVVDSPLGGAGMRVVLQHLDCSGASNPDATSSHELANARS